MKNKGFLGIFLICLGVLGILNKFKMFNIEDYVLILISFGLLVLYIINGARNRYGNQGFLIPAFILLAVQLSDMHFVEYEYHDVLFYLLFGTAFLLVCLIHTISFSNLNFGHRFWPAIVSIPFYSMALLMFSNRYLSINIMNIIFDYLLPISLIVIGIGIIIKNTTK